VVVGGVGAGDVEDSSAVVSIGPGGEVNSSVMPVCWEAPVGLSVWGSSELTVESVSMEEVVTKSSQNI